MLIRHSVERFDNNITDLPVLGLNSGPSNPAVFGLYNFEGPGSTQATAVIDHARQDLFVIECGDTRVVGIWKSVDGASWRAEAMTEDHIGDNPNEQERYVPTCPGEFSEPTYASGYVWELKIHKGQSAPSGRERT
jgi:hypothetical protein